MYNAMSETRSFWCLELENELPCAFFHSRLAHHKTKDKSFDKIHAKWRTLWCFARHVALVIRQHDSCIYHREHTAKSLVEVTSRCSDSASFWPSEFGTTCHLNGICGFGPWFLVNIAFLMLCQWAAAAENLGCTYQRWSSGQVVILFRPSGTCICNDLWEGASRRHLCFQLLLPNVREIWWPAVKKWTCLKQRYIIFYANICKVMLGDSGYFMLLLEVQLWLLFFLSTQISDLTQNGWFATDDLGWMFSHKFHAEVKVVPTAPSMVFQRLDNITETHTLTLKNQYVSLFWSTKDLKTCHDLSFFCHEWMRSGRN